MSRKKEPSDEAVRTGNSGAEEKFIQLFCEALRHSVLKTDSMYSQLELTHRVSAQSETID